MRTGRYNEETTRALTLWFIENKEWPYPDMQEKDKLAQATGLSHRQM
ncbi:unnamed protein product [Discosporangium mesarthrocarpum]